MVVRAEIGFEVCMNHFYLIHPKWPKSASGAFAWVMLVVIYIHVVIALHLEKVSELDESRIASY